MKNQSRILKLALSTDHIPNYFQNINNKSRASHNAQMVFLDIELIFKLWKSYAKLDVIGKWRIERVW